MQRIRYALIMLGIVLCLATPAVAEVRIAISSPHVSIGINLPLYPELVPVPGYPVYYAPRVSANFFFYDGMYWVYQNDYWYTSDWYNGPWWLVEPEYVPVFVLRIPVRYYRHPPPYFYGWPAHAPPRWGHHWGRDWERRHSGWDRWDRRLVPVIAPRPDYQRQYSGKRYPRVEQQLTLHRQLYRYQPRDTIVRERIRPRIETRAPTTVRRDGGQEPSPSSQREQDRLKTSRQKIAPADSRSQQPPPRKIGLALREMQQQSESEQQRERELQRARQDRDSKRQGQGKGKGQEQRQEKEQKDQDRGRN